MCAPREDIPHVLTALPDGCWFGCWLKERWAWVHCSLSLHMPWVTPGALTPSPVLVDSTHHP